MQNQLKAWVKEIESLDIFRIIPKTLTDRRLCTSSCARFWGFRGECSEERCLEKLSGSWGKPTGSWTISGHCNDSKCRVSLRSLKEKVITNCDHERIWEATLVICVGLPHYFVTYSFSVQRRSGRNWRERKWWKDCWWPNCEILPLLPGGWHGAFCRFRSSGFVCSL